MAPNTCFEYLSFVPFTTDESFISNENNPDVNFYNDNFTPDTQSLAPDKFQRNFKPFSKQSLSILHLNIQSINKNFEAFKQFYVSPCVPQGTVCLNLFESIKRRAKQNYYSEKLLRFKYN